MEEATINHPRIAVDAMGGDDGVTTTVKGAAIALEHNADLRFLLVGDRPSIEGALSRHNALNQASEIIHSDNVVAGDARPSQALRRSRNSSMGLAVSSVKEGRADAAVSAGNTGALMAMAKLALRTMDGIDRPALAALLPTLEPHDVVMLDLGANTECDTKNLVQFAVMGAAYSRVMFGFSHPNVGLLNIGTEAEKGTSTLKKASSLLQGFNNLPLNFNGFVEADKISRGKIQVIVTDGFTGNIALKALEGTARFVADLLRRSFMSSVRSKIGFLISRPATRLLRDHLDPNNHNGALFMGLNGVVVKSHGSADPKGIANAINVASRLVEDNILERIRGDLALIQQAANALE